jgi:uncharacterized repeat protein (TIGR01451 family)
MRLSSCIGIARQGPAEWSASGRWITLVAGLVVLAFLAVGAPRANAHYGADGADGEPSTLYWIDPVTLAATPIGPVGFALAGIARGHDDGNLYGVTSATDHTAPNSLILIDLATGAGTPIGPLGLPEGQALTSIAFDDAGLLYGRLESGTVYTVDPDSGAATLLAAVPAAGSRGSGLATTRDGTIVLGGPDDQSTLQTLDPNTGDTLRSVTLGGDGYTLSALTTDRAGNLYGSRLHEATGDAELFSIDPWSGELLVRGQTVSQMRALEFICALQATMTATKTDSPDPVAVGSTLTYTLTVTVPSTSPTSAANVVLNDPLPAQVSLQSASSTQGTCSGTSTVNCNLGNIAVGSSVTITIRVTANASGTITNTGTFTASNALSVTANAVTTVQPTAPTPTATPTVTGTPGATSTPTRTSTPTSTATGTGTPTATGTSTLPVTLALTGGFPPGLLTVGSPTTKAFTIVNQGPGTASNVLFDDTIPANTTLVSAVASQGSCSGATAITCSLGSLAPGASATVTIVLTPTASAAGTTLSNTATVRNVPTGATVSITTTAVVAAVSAPVVPPAPAFVPPLLPPSLPPPPGPPLLPLPAVLPPPPPPSAVAPAVPVIPEADILPLLVGALVALGALAGRRRLVRRLTRE